MVNNAGAIGNCTLASFYWYSVKLECGVSKHCHYSYVDMVT